MDWSFHYIIEIDICREENEDGLNPPCMADTLTKKFQERLGEQPLYVRSVAIMFESSALPDPPFRGLISIPIKGYVQTKGVCMQKLLTWIPSASWKHVLGGLSYSAEFHEDMRKTTIEAGIWMKVDIFGQLRANAHKNRSANAADHKVTLSLAVPSWNQRFLIFTELILYRLYSKRQLVKNLLEMWRLSYCRKRKALMQARIRSPLHCHHLCTEKIHSDPNSRLGHFTTA